MHQKPRFGGVSFLVSPVDYNATPVPYAKLIMPIEFTLVSILFAVVQVALYLFIGRGAMYLLGGATREQNFIYQLFKKGTEPLVKVTRMITPKFVIDRHVPFVTFILLVWVGLMLIYLRRSICVAQQLTCV
jgi:uncharacterized protein YggT (Ycf19 family)